MDNNVKIIDEIKLEHSHLMMRSDGIVEIVFGDFHFTEKEAREWFVELAKLTKGKEMPILKIPGEYASTDESNRKFVANGEGLKYSKAEAFVLKNLAHRIIARIYLTFDKPKKPTKMFSTREEAIQWLYQFRDKSFDELQGYGADLGSAHR